MRKNWDSSKKNTPQAYIILIELLLTASWGFYVLAYRALGALGDIVKPFSWVLKWMWARKKDWQKDIKDSVSVYLSILYMLIKHIVGTIVDIAIPKPKKGDIFGFIKNIARTVLIFSLTLLITGALAIYSLPMSSVVETVMRKLIEFFIKEIFGIFLSLIIVSISVPYAGD